MNNPNLLNIAFEDLFRLTVGLIADDLKVHKHLYHLSLSGLDTALLNLDLYQRIFVLAGFRESDISEELEDWYFERAKRVNNIGLHDEAAIYALSTEILEGLLKMRNTLYFGKTTVK